MYTIYAKKGEKFFGLSYLEDQKLSNFVYSLKDQIVKENNIKEFFFVEHKEEMPISEIAKIKPIFSIKI